VAQQRVNPGCASPYPDRIAARKAAARSVTDDQQTRARGLQTSRERPGASRRHQPAGSVDALWRLSAIR